MFTANFAGHLKVIKRDVFETVGLFDPFFDGCQDYDFVLRAQEYFPITFLQEYLYNYRWHPDTISVAQQKEQARLAQRIVELTRYRRWLSDRSFAKGMVDRISVVLLHTPREHRDSRVARLLASSSQPLTVATPDENGSWLRFRIGRDGRVQQLAGLGGIRTLGDLVKHVDAKVICLLNADLEPRPGFNEHLYFVLTSRHAQAVSPSRPSQAGPFARAPDSLDAVCWLGSLLRTDWVQCVAPDLPIAALSRSAPALPCAKRAGVFLGVSTALLGTPKKG